MNAQADRILTTHAGSLPRPDDLAEMIWAGIDGNPVDPAALEQRLDGAVSEIVGRQRDAGIDIVSDGELSKSGFSTYVNDRFDGFAGRSEFQADDVADFPNLAMRLFATPAMAHLVFANCVGPVTWTGKDALDADIRRLRAALGDADPATAFMGAISPGQIAFNYPDQHYGSHEAYLGALADALASPATGAPTGASARAGRPLTVVRCSAVARDADVAAVDDGDRLVLLRGGEVVADVARPDAVLGNVAVAAAVAFAVGVPAAVVALALPTLPDVPNRRTVTTLSTGARAVDDTFNSNPAGARAALATLIGQATPGNKRVVVTPGMVELGPVQAAENAAWAGQAASSATHLVVVGATNRKALLAGAGSVADAARARVVVVATHADAVAWVRANTGPGDVVLYENQLPDHYP